MRLLIANDDGIHSPGLALLARVAARFGDTRVVAPEAEQSSSSHAITSSRPMTYRRTQLAGGVDAYRVNGTPADCVTLGLYHPPRADVVLSGINLGSNLGNGMWHSGTLAAAQQAVLLGVRGIALSTPSVAQEPELAGLEPYVERVLELLLPRDDLRLVNVNLPARPRGIHWTRQAVEQYDGEVVPARDPYERPIYWVAVTTLHEHAPGTDLWAFEHGYITITPLRLDMTDQRTLGAIEPAERVIEFEDQPAPALISEEEAGRAVVEQHEPVSLSPAPDARRQPGQPLSEPASRPRMKNLPSRT